MPGYEVRLSKQAERVLVRMAERQPELYRRIAQALDDLGHDPFQGQPLRGELRRRYSYRVGSYRILYLVERHRLLVLVIDVAHRRDIYR